ncbi:MAG TPA: type II and III secretion system protein family protein [Desulfuromonadales bacterium]|nr:type II and III secretion system protein family protein [Desulfuromonadales bacterium]
MKRFAFGALAGKIGLAAMLVLLCGVAWAQQETERKILPLKLGGSEIIEIQKPSYNMKVLTSDEEIVHARALTERKVYVRGQKLGYCTITVWDEDKKDVRAVIDVTVSLDLTGLKEQIRQLFPNQQIEVYGSETGVVLAGTVSGPEVMEKVLRLAQTFLPREAEGKSSTAGGTGRSGHGITNLLQVAGNQQVMLEVKFAEEARDKSKDWQAAIGLGKLGNDFTGAASAGGRVVSPLKITEKGPFPAVIPGGTVGQVIEGTIDGLIQQPSSLLLNFAGNAANLFVNVDNLTTAMTLLENEGLARVLAEPRLVTQSGQEASFLAGGEFPYPVPDEDGTPGIEFKEFGVALRFTPVIMADGKISLRVAPSVSEISDVSLIPTGVLGSTFPVPNLNTRKLETTVQLYDGQTLALAGLLKDNLREEVSKIPGLGDLPILGPLFRSSGYLQEKTDLLIAVTPHLVNPVAEGELRFPGEFMQLPSQYEFYIEGRLEGRRSADNPSALSRHGFPQPPDAAGKSGGLEGKLGFQASTN